MKKSSGVICGTYKKFEKPKISQRKNNNFFSILCSKWKNEAEKIFKVEEWIEVLKNIALIDSPDDRNIIYVKL